LDVNRNSGAGQLFKLLNTYIHPIEIPNLKNGRGRNDYNNEKPGNKTQFPAKWC